MLRLSPTVGLFVVLGMVSYVPQAMAQNTRAAERACVKAVAQKTNNTNVRALSSQFSQAGTRVIVGVGPQRARWQCIAYRNGTTAGIQFLGSDSAGVRPQATPPQIIAGTNREAEVIFKGNNCVVYYRRNGTRREANRNCRRGQVSRADTAMAAYRREQGWDRPAAGHSGNLAPPQIIAGRNREAEVIFKANNCVVYYRKNGTRREANRNCRRGQVSRADTAMAAYRREQGWDRPAAGHSGNLAPPQIIARPNGSLKVVFRNNKCEIKYNRRGKFTDQTAWCSAAHRSRAARAVAAYRREQGLGG